MAVRILRDLQCVACVNGKERARGRRGGGEGCNSGASL